MSHTRASIPLPQDSPSERRTLSYLLLSEVCFMTLSFLCMPNTNLLENLLFGMILNLQKNFQKSIKKPCIPFIQIHQLLTFCPVYHAQWVVQACTRAHTPYKLFFWTPESKCHTSCLIIPKRFKAYFLKPRRFCETSAVELAPSGKWTVLWLDHLYSSLVRWLGDVLCIRAYFFLQYRSCSG